MNYDIITFGSATIDIFVQPKEEHVVELCTPNGCENMVAYPSGGKILIEEPHIEIGGGGTNTAACLANLGLRVAYCGAVGTDHHGNDVIEGLKRGGVSFVGLRTATPTNMSVVLDIHKLHDRTILAYKGASDTFTREDLDLAVLQSTWYYFSSLLGKSYQTMIDLMWHARSHGIAVAFNPSSYQTQQGIDAILQPIQLSQLLILNKEEAEMLVGSGSADELCKRLRQKGAEIVLVTDGAQGATLLYADTLYSAKPRNDITVLDTTGAGDCFASSFLAGLALSLSPGESLRLAFVNAENLITQIGAKHGLLHKEEAFSRLHQDKREIQQKPAW